MQNKGAITTFAIVFAIASLFQLSFTWITNNIEEDAVEYANGDKTKEVAYLDSMSSVGVFNLGIKNYTFKECQERELNLGLDLKGGMNVTLEVSVVDVIRSLSNYSKDPTFNAAIKKSKEYQKDSQEEFVTLFGRSFNEIDANAKLASVFATLEMKDRINYNSTNEEVLAVIKEQVDGAIKNSFNIIRTRIDRFGVSQPNIQPLETNGRVLVELPGVKDPERVRKLLQGTAELSFWEAFDNKGDDKEKGIYYYLIDANDIVYKIQNEEEKKEIEDTIKTKEVKENIVAEEKVETDTVIAESDTTTKSLLDLDNTVETSTDSVSKSDQAKRYPIFQVLNLNINRENGQPNEGVVVGFARAADTVKVNEYLKIKQVQALFPRKLRLMWTVKPYKGTDDYFQLVAVKSAKDGRPSLDGDVVTDARVDYGRNQATAEVSMTMNTEGAQKWRQLTKQNIGHPIAIVLDGYVYSFPNVISEIKNGSSSITGDFTIKEAEDLANVLKSGKLPAPAHIIEEAIVGPSLGQEAINAGLMSFIIAFAVVLLYMLFYYNGAGLVANIALITNIFFIFGVLASLGAVLTLPGIAGIVLTIGMSVDANVLIYERIKEELMAGKGLKLAISDGYKNAYSAIIDANVTTLLTGIILYVFGSGPIKGFATTLVIGILTSLFTAIFITRLIFTVWLAKGKNVKFATKATESAFKNLKIKFIEKRKIWYVVSGLFITIGIVSLFTQKLDLGIDFTGGRVYVVRFENPENVDIVKIRESLTKEFEGNSPEVKIFGEKNQVRISTKYNIDDDSQLADEKVEEKLYAGLKDIFENPIGFEEFLSAEEGKIVGKMSSQKVGPTIADDIKVDAVLAIFFSLIVIFLYILVRFRNWQFGLGALAALVHDVLIVLGIFSLLKSFMPFAMEVDQAFIAAILTVVGYSINDTVVVFDRIREYLGLHPKRDRTENYNDALNSTISRTVSTSLSTFVVLLSIFIFGGEVIRGFIFALLIGVVVGTYSSLFIATPISFDTIKRKDKIIDKKKK
jgi:SecD/SecF fusion protein